MTLTDFLLRLARISAEAGVVILLVLAVQLIFRRQLSPHWRCALWLLVVARLLPLSFPSSVSLFNALPAWLGGSAPVGPSELDRTGVVRGKSMAEQSNPGRVPKQSITEMPAALPVGAESGAQANAAIPTNSTRTGFPVEARSARATILFWIWLGGVAALGGYVAAASMRLQRRLSRLRPMANPTIASTLQSSCAQLGLRRPPPVFESAEVATPALYGLFRPRLLLPRGFRESFSDEELRFVFLHELAHLRRRDLLLNWLVTTLQVVHWFNPLVWLGFARWRVDREIACDALALSAAGRDAAQPYGRTMLRLLENISWHAPQPALVGILESPRQLRRRMRMIAGYAPARRPLPAIILMAALALVALTDAEMASTPAAKPVVAAASPAPMPASNPAPVAAVVAEPVPTTAPHKLTTVTLNGEFVVFLVRASGSMLGETVDDAAARTHGTAEEKRRAPKWQRTLQAVQHMVSALESQTEFQIILFNEQVTPLPRVPVNRDPRAVAEQWALLERVVPQGGANLERAFAAMLDLPHLPSRVVLFTDALPTASNAPAGAGDTTEAQRRAFFDAAVKQLPSIVPISTVLLPLFPEDAATAGAYWELANATHGEFFAPNTSRPAGGSNYVAFVIDTSGSMRDPKNGGLWPIVTRKLEEVLNSHPNLAGVQLLDGDGRFILGRRGSGATGWHADGPELRERINTVLRNYDQDSVSNPVPGVTNALRFLHDKATPDMRMAIYVFGDEFIQESHLVLDRLDELNPRGAGGQRPVIINAIGFPTTIRHPFSMGKTGLKFADLMHRIAYEHGGVFIALQDL